MVERTCENCGARFEAREKDVRRGYGKFCSKACANEYRARGRPTHVCKNCGEEFRPSAGQVRAGYGVFCCKDCQMEYQRGENNPNYRGGAIGYACDNCGAKINIMPCDLQRTNKHFCSRQCQNMYQARHQPKVSGPERRMAAALEEHGIEFTPQAPLMNMTIADFYIPGWNLVVYCDGDYWHNLPNYVERDIRINRALDEAGYSVLRFWEHEINADVGACVSRIEAYGNL